MKAFLSDLETVVEGKNPEAGANGKLWQARRPAREC
jgi:hypothetical protein